MNSSTNSLSQSMIINKRITDINLMDDHIQSILIAISKNPVTNVVALAGTGKSTSLPIGIANSGNKITVVVSDSGIAESLATYVKSKTNLSVNTSINSPTNITYISLKDLKNHMFDVISNKGCMDLDFTDILMIDEADSGSLDQTMTQLLWRFCAEKRSKIPRLLLVSTTPINSNLFDVEIYNVPTIMYPIEIRYSDKNYSKSFSLSITNRGNNNLINDTIDLIYNTHTSSVEGDILVFTSGKYQSETISQILRDMKIEGADIFTAHEDLDKKDIDEIYEYTPNRRIVVADSLAETTFTLRELGIIIDMMVDQKPELTLTGGLRYPKRYITKHQSNVRCSRGGRYQPLLCYRMVTKSMFNKLRPSTQSQIYHVPLHYVMLDLMENNIDPYDILNIFPKETLDHNYNLMLRLGVINVSGRITKVGDFTKKIPFGMRNSVALYRWLGTTNGSKNLPPYPAIVLLSMIDSFGKSYFIYPLREKGISHAEYNLELLEHHKRHFNPFEGKSDIHTYSNMWNIMMDEVGGPQVPSSDIIDWCEDNAIRTENMLEVIGLISNITNIMRESGTIDVGPFDTDNTLDLLGPILKDIYQDRKFIYDPTGGVRVRYVGDNKYYKIDSQNSINSIERDIPNTVYGLITSTISSKYGADFHLISCSLV